MTSIVRAASLRQLQVFEAIARLESFTRAAAELHLTQPTVSMQVKKLEESIGLPLFEFVGKKFYLTHAGKLLQETAVDVLHSLTHFDMSIADEKGLKTGHLRLAVVTTAKYFAPRVLGRFSKHYPGVELALKVTNRERIIERMNKNMDDLYIMGMPPETEFYHFEKFIENPIKVIVPRFHPLANANLVSLQRIAQEPFIVREQGSGTRLAIENLFSAMHLRLNVRMELGSNEAIKEAVAGGLGISALSMHAIVPEGSKEICVIEVERFPILWHWFVGFPANKRLSVIAKTFLDFMNAEVHFRPNEPMADTLN